MKQHFNHSTCLEDVKLPLYLKQQLWRDGIVNNAPAMDIIARIADDFIATEEDAHLVVKDTIKAIGIAEHHAGEFFAYRGSKIPDDVYYSILGRSYIDLLPEAFTHLPESYRELESRFRGIKSNPDKYLDAQTDGRARFSFAIHNIIRMENLLRGLRTGALSLGAAGPAAEYNDLVPAVGRIMKGDSRLTQESQLLGRDIDFIINNHDLGRFWYIQSGAFYAKQIDDKGFLFDKSCVPDAGRLRSVFNSAYQHYENLRGEAGIEAYYDFSEKVMAPLRLLCNREKTFQEDEMLYTLAVETMPFEDEVERAQHAYVLYPVSEEYIQDDAIARHLNAFQFDAMKYWGNRVQPFVFVGEMAEFRDRLQVVQDLSITTPFLQSYRDYCVNIAGQFYNRMARNNAALGFEIFEMPDSGARHQPAPANDLN